ncbi:7500_t:CDS:2, partial [Racocetra persica]
PTIMISWGITVSFMAFVKSYTELMFTRALLGVFEAGLLPGIVYYITIWYKRYEQGFRMGIIISSISLGGAFSGLFAYTIASLTDENSPLKAWQLIFIIDGLVSIIVAIIAYFYITDYPEDAKWLTQEERLLAVLRLSNNLSPPLKCNIGVAMMISCGNCGGIIAGQIYRSVDYPNYVLGHSIALSTTLAAACLSAIQYVMLGRLNELKKREKISKTSDLKSIEEDEKELGDRHYNFEYT